MKRLCLLAVLIAVAGSATVRHGKNLDKVNLAGRDLRSRNFAGATLTAVDLRRADLRRASFRGACLWEVDLRGARLDQPEARRPAR